MPPTPADCGPVRPAAVINAEIRGLWERAPLSPQDEERYRLLLVEWAAAQRCGTAQDDVTAAA